ncbi:hypothetical protein K458DRAFT_382454 [Lentithecium fluviatile CBS 122367]|uniref:Uncharacterized protein n=1 Tax=Lentithecium fluviatile CBS 122367 TaxID=1168545 RepID=A0A6G1JJZ6_9PLEO|nr:hypothetical protein K458DRAFT_382454 [Lentithecium fluviatile CBS 122367]
MSDKDQTAQTILLVVLGVLILVATIIGIHYPDSLGGVILLQRLPGTMPFGDAIARNQALVPPKPSKEKKSLGCRLLRRFY